MIQPTPTILAWPPDARVLGWFDGGSADTPYAAPCVWIEHALPGDPAHRSIRPAALVPPELVIPDTLENPWIRTKDGDGFRQVPSWEMESGQ